MLKEILVLFKTHLDIGFTDLSASVVRNYLNSYIPKALAVAKEMRGQEERFIWTMGSWMIREFLRVSPMRAEMEEAIAAGDIRWHGLPFTTHTELMDKKLFCHGLSISKSLDHTYGKTTTAAKMTDVPGHTRALVPLMAGAGLKFLHIGVNPASTVPDVPPLFRWKAPSGEEILVMYEKDYGQFAEIGDTGTALYFAHTGDNHGPQSKAEIEKVYRELRRQYPGVTLRAATLEDVAAVAVKATNLPVITEEIGDSWIHGVGTDPRKVSNYRALLRLSETFSAEEQEQVLDNLLLIPEHTWGLDEKTHLGHRGFGEHRYFIRKEFESARAGERFQKMEESWNEQRAYVTAASKSLSGNARQRAEEAVAEYRREKPSLENYRQLENHTGIVAGDYLVDFNESGAICGLKKGTQLLADENHPWGQVVYHAYSQEEYDRFKREYVTNLWDWAVEDFGKIGIEKAIKQQLTVTPILTGIHQMGDTCICSLQFRGDATEQYGAPKEMMLEWKFLPDTVLLDVAWWEKPATRVAESLSIQFVPIGAVQGVRKLSEWIDPLQVISKGNRFLHGTDFGVQYDTLRIESLDTPLVGIGEGSLLAFPDTLPKREAKAEFFLYNNVWGTNFVMWYEEDARFRFRMDQFDRTV